MSSLPRAKFLMLYEYSKCGTAIREVLTSKNIHHFALDDFFQLEANELKETVLCKALVNHAYDLIGEDSWEFTQMLFRETYIVNISRQGIRIGTLFRSIDFLLRTTGSQLRSTCV